MAVYFNAFLMSSSALGKTLLLQFLCERLINSMTILHGRTCIITGGASGIGLATAHHLKMLGAKPILWDINETALKTAGQDVNADAQVVDICDAKQVETALTETLQRYRTIDCFIHAAGILQTGLFSDMSLTEHTRMIAVNLQGTINVVQQIIPMLKDTGGSLILLGSVSAFVAAPDFATYAATKAAVYSLAQTLRIELAATGIHIGIANPLYVATPMLSEQVRQSRSVANRSPLLHVYPVEAVAKSIVRGIERREFMIWTGMRPRLIYWLSRYAAWLVPTLSRWTWEHP
jgi:short-subunit dehydrogenase